MRYETHEVVYVQTEDYLAITKEEHEELKRILKLALEHRIKDHFIGEIGDIDEIRIIDNRGNGAILQVKVEEGTQA